MSGGLPTTIPTYIATSVAGGAPLGEFEFSGGAPPVDGSVGLCYITIDPTTGLTFTNGAIQRLAYFKNSGTGTGPGQAEITGGIWTYANLAGWSFVADAAL